MWHKACVNTDCIEVAQTCDQDAACVTLRDSTQPDKTITVSDSDFAEFARGIKAGRLDKFLAGLNAAPVIAAFLFAATAVPYLYFHL